MNVCPSCGSPTLDSDVFCASCGTRLQADTERSCPKCGAPVSAADRHCRRCGTVLDGDQTQGIPIGGDTTGTAPARDQDHDTQLLPAASRADPYLAPRSWAPEPEPEGPKELRYGEPPARRRETPVGAIVALLAAVAVVASGFLEWRAEALGGGTAADIPLRFLADPRAEAGPGDVTVALILLGLGTLGAVAALLSILLPGFRFLRRVLGGFTLVVPIVVVVRSELTLRFLSGEHSFLDSIGRGVWLCASAAVVEIVAGRWFRR
ncbi:MAG: zinc ribbon domain-containing protein [Actinomycetota bacterium]